MGLQPPKPSPNRNQRTIPVITNYQELQQYLQKLRIATNDVLPQAQAPSLVSDFKVTSATGGNQITWSPVAGADGYVISYSDNGHFTDLKQISTRGSQTSYFDGSATAKRAYKIAATTGTPNQPQSQVGPNTGIQSGTPTVAITSATLNSSISSSGSSVALALPIALGPNAVLGGQNYYDHLASGTAFAGETGTSQIDLGFQIAEGSEQNTYAKGIALSLINNPPTDIVGGPGQVALSVFSADDPLATHRCGQINAIYGAAAHLGSGLADVVEGLNFTAINQGPGPVTTLYGAFIGSANYGNDGVTLTGTVTAARSLNVQTPIAETGNITTGYGIYIEKPLFANSKILSHLYGIYFEDMSNSSGGTNSDPWAIYESVNNKNQLGQTTFIGLAGFSSGSGIAADAGLSRLSAGVIACGNGTQSDFSGTLKTGTVIYTAATPTGSGSQVSFGTTTATSATAGANGAVPSQVVGYLTIDIGGTKYKIPYFAV